MFTPWLSHEMSFSMSWAFSTLKGTVYAQPLPEMTLYEAGGGGTMEITLWGRKWAVKGKIAENGKKMKNA
jgi:hypothetical protein